MAHDDRRPPLRERLLTLRRQIVAQQVRLECARLLRGRYGRLSDLGWLFSIGTGAAGTVLAVRSGQLAGQWGDVVADLEHELWRLEVERRLCEHDLVHLTPEEA